MKTKYLLLYRDSHVVLEGPVIKGKLKAKANIYDQLLNSSKRRISTTDTM